MRENISVRDWQVNFVNGEYDAPDFHTQVKAGWYDWFCKNSSLRAKTVKMGNIIITIKDNGKVNLDTTYVWFKNNCPCSYPLYDDFRIADMETGQVLLTVVCGSTYPTEKRYCVYGRRNGNPNNEFESKPLFETDKVKELKVWLNQPW